MQNWWWEPREGVATDRSENLQGACAMLSYPLGLFLVIKYLFSWVLQPKRSLYYLEITHVSTQLNSYVPFQNLISDLCNKHDIPIPEIRHGVDDEEKPQNSSGSNVSYRPLWWLLPGCYMKRLSAISLLTNIHD